MTIRHDLEVIASLIKPKSRVLDIGCGDGTLLKYLQKTYHVDGHGMELSHDGVHQCVRDGLAVVQGDADTDLGDYPDNAFDYAILGQTLQATHEPLKVLKHIVRIAHYGIVSFPNFAYWKIRLHVLLRGTMPQSQDIPYPWHETPNIHLCTIKDFRQLCHHHHITIIAERTPRKKKARRLSNWQDALAVFIIQKSQPPAIESALLPKKS